MEKSEEQVEVLSAILQAQYRTPFHHLVILRIAREREYVPKHLRVQRNNAAVEAKAQPIVCDKNGVAEPESTVFLHFEVGRCLIFCLDGREYVLEDILVRRMSMCGRRRL